MNGLVIPDVFADAKFTLEETIEAKRQIELKKYNTPFSMPAQVNMCHIEKIDDEDSYSNLDMVITYSAHDFSESEGMKEVQKTRKLKFLCTKGDTAWTPRTKMTIWDNKYPSTVAVDMETGEVLFVYLKRNSIDFMEFGILDESQFENFELELNDREPFSIGIDPNAMFKFIDGDEGYRHLRENIIVTFNCAVPVQIRCSVVSPI